MPLARHRGDMRPIVLIVASDDWHRYRLSVHLQQEGFRTSGVAPATMSWHRSTGYGRTWSLISLFVDDASGLDACSQIRRRSEVPFVILTGWDAD